MSSAAQSRKPNTHSRISKIGQMQQAFKAPLTTGSKHDKVPKGRQ